MSGYFLDHPKGAAALLLVFLLAIGGAAFAQPPPPPVPVVPEVRGTRESTEVILHKIEGKDTISVGKIFVGSGGPGGVHIETGKGDRHRTIDINVGDKDEGNDIVRFGEDITIEEGRTVSGDVVSVGGSVKVMGEVIGDVVAVGGNVRVGAGAVVGGDAVSVGGRVTEDEGSQVRGSNVSVSLPGWILGTVFRHRMHPVHPVGWAVGRIIGAGIILFLGWLIVTLMGRRMTYVCEYVRQRWGLSLAVGFLVMVLFLPAFVILCVTIIGIPIALVLPFALGLATFIGFIAGSVLLGEFLLQRSGRVAGSVVRAMAAGVLLLLSVIFLGGILRAIGDPISWIGVIFKLVAWVGILLASLSGLGAIVLSRFGTRLPPTQVAPPIPPTPVTAGPPVSPA